MKALCLLGVFSLGIAAAAADAAAQVRCLMPNGRWIEQRLSSECPVGTKEAQTIDGAPAPIAKPREPVVPAAPPKPLRNQLSVESKKQAVPFEACVRFMARTVLDVGSRNTRVIVNAPDLRMLRVCSSDGSVLITCSRVDSTMVLTKSSKRCD